MRVPGFLPTINGLHFTNNFPPGPDYTFSVLGQTIKLGSSSHAGRWTNSALASAMKWTD